MLKVKEKYIKPSAEKETPKKTIADLLKKNKTGSEDFAQVLKRVQSKVDAIKKKYNITSVEPKEQTEEKSENPKLREKVEQRSSGKEKKESSDEPKRLSLRERIEQRKKSSEKTQDEPKRLSLRERIEQRSSGKEKKESSDEPKRLSLRERIEQRKQQTETPKLSLREKIEKLKEKKSKVNTDAEEVLKREQEKESALERLQKRIEQRKQSESTKTTLENAEKAKSIKKPEQFNFNQKLAEICKSKKLNDKYFSLVQQIIKPETAKDEAEIETKLTELAKTYPIIMKSSLQKVTGNKPVSISEEEIKNLTFDQRKELLKQELIRI